MVDGMPVFFLAHPVAPCDGYTYKQNLRHVVQVQEVLYNKGIYTVIPWISLLSFLPDDGEHRNRAIAIGCEVAAALGAIILVGHKITGGMLDEVRAVRRARGIVIDATSLSIEALPDYITECIKSEIP